MQNLFSSQRREWAGRLSNLLFCQVISSSFRSVHHAHRSHLWTDMKIYTQEYVFWVSIVCLQIKAIHTERIYVRLRPSRRVDARRRATTDVDARLRRYRTHAKRPARSHQARLRPSTDVDGRRRASTSVNAVLIIQWQATLWHVTCS